MFAIVEVAGQQFKVEKDENIFVHRLAHQEGEKIVLDQVLLIEDDGKTVVGTPVVKGYQVKATVIAHLKGDKVKVFKKKRRKGYQKLNGHRQYLTEIRIDAIGKGKTAAPKAAAGKEEGKEASAAEAKAATKSAPKAKAAPKKTETTKKTGAKTATAKKEGTTTARKTTATKAKSTTAKAKKPAAKKSEDNKKEEK